MPKSRFTQAALAAAVLSAAALSSAHAADEAAKKPGGVEKCFGIAKAGENSCHTANGSHGCGSMSKTDYLGEDFKVVPGGTCEAMNGSLKPFDGKNPKIKG
jgi:uncharacterized membrane protein